jgi:hypothetical protein
VELAKVVSVCKSGVLTIFPSVAGSRGRRGLPGPCSLDDGAVRRHSFGRFSKTSCGAIEVSNLLWLSELSHFCSLPRGLVVRLTSTRGHAMEMGLAHDDRAAPT